MVELSKWTAGISRLRQQPAKTKLILAGAASLAMATATMLDPMIRARVLGAMGDLESECVAIYANTFKDPSSVSIETSVNDGLRLYVQVRAKNSFGASDIDHITCHLDLIEGGIDRSRTVLHMVNGY